MKIKSAFTLAEGATHVDRQHDKGKFAFTLAEVLITLGIIGVVAALTIPTLLNEYKTQVLRAQYDKTYSVLSQAVNKMFAHDVPIGPDSRYFFRYPNHRLFHKYLMEGLNVSVFCGIGSLDGGVGCPTFDGSNLVGYTTFNNEGMPSSSWIGGTGGTDETSQNIGTSFVLSDGTLIFTANDFWANKIMVTADINGMQKGPNRYGYDLFTFEFKDGVLLPMGHNKSSYPGWANHTQLCRWTNISGGMNGHSCSQKAHEDRDYFKKVFRGSW